VSIVTATVNTRLQFNDPHLGVDNVPGSNDLVREVIEVAE